MSCHNEDIEMLSDTTNSSTEIMIEKTFKKYVPPHQDIIDKFVVELCTAVSSMTNPTKTMIDDISEKIMHKARISISKADIRNTYDKTFQDTIKISPILRKWMIKKSARSNSGVLVVTIVLSPHKFSCKYDCHYCPQETDLKGNHTQPRSYLSTEPAMLRAIASRNGDSYDFDIKKQFQSRVRSYIYTGSIKIVDEENDNKNKSKNQSYKMEIILSGGTWESYPIEYREQVINELYYSANTLSSSEKEQRPMKSLTEEIKENETTIYRIIGLTLETRPDNITPQSIQDYCRWGATRIQIGVQHFDDAILRKINRKCYTKDTIRAIRLLKQAGFKVVIHLMPDLPGSTPELDKWMFSRAITDPALQFDDLKIYPTAVCKSPDPDRIVKSKIADWYRDGVFIPYAEKNLNDLIEVLMYYKTRVQPWIRIQRVIRDIPEKSMEAGYNKVSNLRQVIDAKMKLNGTRCMCIFCMEIGDNELDTNIVPMLVVRKYEASEGIEYFITVEAHRMEFIDKWNYFIWFIGACIMWLFTCGRWNYWSGNDRTYSGLYGFLRLRIDPNPGGDFIPEINGCALIREVHVYGSSLGVGEDSKGSQHRGFGKKMMAIAEKISIDNGFNKTAVIAGIGTREYYKNKCGYVLGGTYMLKTLR